MPTSELEDLLARVEKATGPDREIDLAMMLIAFPDTDESHWLKDTLGRRDFGNQWKVTASLDAALALANREWDGMWSLRYNGAGYTGEMQDWPPIVCRAQTAPLALLGALLRALIDRQEKA